MRCRFCGTRLRYIFASLGTTPLSNAFIDEEKLTQMEPHYPLVVYVCDHCFLVQLQEFESPEVLFKDYAYFSSYSDTWLKHVKAYAEKMTREHGINPHSFVIEVASNDGYLLQYFVRKEIPVLGIEPAINVAHAAIAKGVPTEAFFFSKTTAKELSGRGKLADLVIANNVLAHVPNLNDFVAGLKTVLKPTGFITIEFPHLLRLIEEVQFDTIYHEHFSYFSFLTIERIFLAHGLSLFDVERLETHGGSLRIYAKHTEDSTRPVQRRVLELRNLEASKGYETIENYLTFMDKVNAAKRALLSFLILAKESGKHVAAYGAPAKGNTLLNYCGIGTDFVDYTVDRNPQKQGRYLPGSHIHIKAPEEIPKTKPDYMLILPWNLADEITEQMSMIRTWGGKFVIPIPEPKVF
jgi:hypothetical protein